MENKRRTMRHLLRFAKLGFLQNEKMLHSQPTSENREGSTLDASQQQDEQQQEQKQQQLEQKKRQEQQNKKERTPGTPPTIEDMSTQSVQTLIKSTVVHMLLTEKDQHERDVMMSYLSSMCVDEMRECSVGNSEGSVTSVVKKKETKKEAAAVAEKEEEEEKKETKEEKKETKKEAAAVAEK